MLFSRVVVCMVLGAEYGFVLTQDVSGDIESVEQCWADQRDLELPTESEGDRVLSQRVGRKASPEEEVAVPPSLPTSVRYDTEVDEGTVGLVGYPHHVGSEEFERVDELVTIEELRGHR